jgi:NAD(P)-dependent dehydrogenase (short-subunit alcohol dehydrogenase family)
MTDATSLEGRTAVVTGAGAGLGRAEALALARRGANVVVNDIDERAKLVADEITDAGGAAVAVPGDVGQWSIGETLLATAIDTFGSLDVVVNNAGILRDRMIFNLEEDDWDDVVRVHLKGHAAVTVAAARHWRDRSKETGEPQNASIINTASEAFLFGAPGQPNYSAAKAGIVALTLSTGSGLARYGVRANVICPRARTGMTEGVFEAPQEGDADPLAPERPAELVAYLASPAARDITGQVFVVYSDFVALLAPPTVEQVFRAPNEMFNADEIAGVLSPYFDGRDAHKTFAAYSVAELDNTGP